MAGRDPGRDWHPSIPTEIPGPPTLSVSYDRLEGMDLIGSGGDADVYRATVSHDGETHTIAVKQPRFESTMHVDTLDRFSDEAETWEKLDDHPNIVGVIDWGTEPLPWLALEYMDGGHLGDRALPLSLEEGLWVGWCLCRSVRHAHRRGVAHLDIKPANVLFRETGPDTWMVPKVSDWGLSKLLLEHSGTVTGFSPTYAAPEQVDPDRYGGPDDFTDIYQVGAVLYEALVGEPPFTGPSATVMRAVLEDDPIPPSERNPDMPTTLDSVVLAALSKEKADRPESIIHLREEIESVIDDLPTGGDEQRTAATAATGSAPGQSGGGPPDPDPEPGSAPADEGPTEPLVGSRFDRRALLKAGGGLVVLGGVGVAANETLRSGSQPAADGGDGGGDGGGAGGPVETATDTSTPSDGGGTTDVPSRQIKLGVLMAVSGGLGSIGPSIRNAAQLAATYVTENSDTFTIDVQFEDTATDPDTGISGAKALVDGGYPMYAGALSSTVTLQVAREVAIPTEMVGCSPSSTTPAITELEDNDYIYRTTPHDTFQSRVLAQVGRQHLDAQTTAYLAQSNDYGQALATAYATAWRDRGGSVQAEVSFESGKSSYSTELDRALHEQPDLLLVVGFLDPGRQILRDFYADYGQDFCDIIVPDGLKNADLPDDVDNSMRNVWGTAPLAAGPGLDFFEQQYVEEYGTTDAPFTAHSWDAAAVLCLANAAAGENDARAVRDQVRTVANAPGTKITPQQLPEGLEMAARGEQINYQGASGPIGFDANGDITTATYELFRYDADGLETVDRIDFAQ